jgi:PAS domain S-box-containing protein
MGKGAGPSDGDWTSRQEYHWRVALRARVPPRAPPTPIADVDLARRMLEAAPDAMLAVDGEGKIELVNQQVELLFGYPREELLGRKIEMLLPERFAKGHVAHRSKFVSEPLTRPMGFGLPLAGRRRDGTEFPVDISLSPVETRQGPLVVAAIRDITDRRRVEDEVRKVDERFRQLVESSPDGMVILDPAGRIQQVNEQAEVQFGYTRDEMTGHPVEMLLPERLRGVHVAHRNGYLVHPTARPMGAGLELAGRRKDGSEFPVDISLSPLETSQGRFGVARIRDVTERLRVDRELKEKAAMVDLAHDAIFVLDPIEGRIQYWNRGAGALYQYSPEEAVGAIGGDLLKRVAPASFAEMVAKATEADYWNGRLQHTTKSGDQLVVESRWAVLRDHAGGVSGILEINRDITAQLRAEGSLREANELLEARVDELEAFSSTVSHDLRTPLRALNGFVDVLVEEAPDQLNPEALDALDEIRGNAIRMGQLIDDLLAFARLGLQELQKTEVDMHRLAKRTVDRLTKLAAGRPIELSIEPMPHCHGDPALLEHVWTNLLTNAIKFTGGRRPAQITAGAEVDGGRVIYFVKDNGVGFDMAYVGKLFGVFQRLHAADEFEGTGVGLATVMRICARHGGSAWAEAMVDKGATFYFTVAGGSRR